MPNPFHLPNKVYNFLKALCLIGLPAFGTAYMVIGQIWELDNVSKVVGTIVAIETLLGTLLGISTKVYNNSEEKYAGTIHSSIEAATGMNTFTLELNEPPETIPGKSELIFKVDVS